MTRAFSECSKGERLWPLAVCIKQAKTSAPLTDSGFCYLTELCLNALGKNIGMFLWSRVKPFLGLKVNAISLKQTKLFTEVGL